jgi:uncharacterized membrane protein
MSIIARLIGLVGVVGIPTAWLLLFADFANLINHGNWGWAIAGGFAFIIFGWILVIVSVILFTVSLLLLFGKLIVWI